MIDDSQICFLSRPFLRFIFVISRVVVTPVLVYVRAFLLVLSLSFLSLSSPSAVAVVVCRAICCYAPHRGAPTF